MRDIICGIYYIKNLINNKYYIGQSINIYERWIREKYHLNFMDKAWNIHLQNAWKKYGQDNFEFAVVEECDKDELNNREIYWIQYYDAFYNGYNMTLGGDGGTVGYRHTEEDKEKMRQIKKNIVPPMKNPDVVAKVIESRKWYKPSIETKRKIAEAWTDNMKRNAANRLADRNKILKSIPVLCIETETIYNSAREAERATGISQAIISKCCNGKGYKSAGKGKNGEKLHWRYATKEDLNAYLLYSEVAC